MQIVLLAMIALTTPDCATSRDARKQDRAPEASFAVTIYALSKGAGVPAAARSALNDARTLLERLEREHRVRRITASRIGLEGETRLCAEFADQQAARETLEQLRHLAHDVDLLTVTDEPCATRE